MILQLIGYGVSARRAKYRKGLCTAHIFHGPDDGQVTKVRLAYEAEDTGDGYVVYCERPEVSGASDLLQDVTAALESEGVNVLEIIWL